VNLRNKKKWDKGKLYNYYTPHMILHFLFNDAFSLALNGNRINEYLIAKYVEARYESGTSWTGSLSANHSIPRFDSRDTYTSLKQRDVGKCCMCGGKKEVIQNAACLQVLSQHKKSNIAH
jgi:hypothetical protein